MSIVLATENLEKRFGGIVATNNVSLKVEKGARHALIGPNGAGKTTIINLLTGVLGPTAGKVLLEELLEPVAAHGAVREVRRRGFMTGIELVDFPLEARMGHRVTLEARRLGAIIRPLGDVVVLMPPLSISLEELRRLVSITFDAIESATTSVALAQAA